MAIVNDSPDLTECHNVNNNADSLKEKKESLIRERCSANSKHTEQINL